MLYGKM